MIQIISSFVSIAIAVAIFYVIVEIRRETARLSKRARTWPPQALHEEQGEAITAAVTPSTSQG